MIVELTELAIQSGGAVTQAAITQLSHNPPVQGQVVRQNSWKAQSVANIQLIQNFLAPSRYLPVALPAFEVFRPHMVDDEFCEVHKRTAGACHNQADYTGTEKPACGKASTGRTDGGRTRWVWLEASCRRGQVEGVPPHLELALQPAALSEEGVCYPNVVLCWQCFHPLFPQRHLS